MNTTTNTRLNRKKAYRGMDVKVIDAAGREITGTLTGWGAQLVTITPDAESKARGWTWKRYSFHTSAVEVFAV